MTARTANACLVIGCFLLLQLSLTSQTLQTIRIESKKFRLESTAPNSGNIKYTLSEIAGDSLIVKKTFDESYYFGRKNEAEIVIVEHSVGNKKQENILDMNRGDFAFSWTDDITPFSDTLFKTSVETSSGEKEWQVFTHRGEIILRKKDNSYYGPTINTNSQLIYFHNVKDTVELYTTKGALFKRFTGYSYPTLMDGAGLRMVDATGNYGLLSLEGKLLIPFDNSALEFMPGKILRLRNVDTTTRLEVYKTGQSNPFFITPAQSILEVSTYREQADGSTKDYFIVANGSMAEYFNDKMELFLKWPGTIDEYCNINEASGDMYVLASALSDKSTPMLIKDNLILAHHPKALLFLMDIRSERKTDKQNFVAVADPDYPKPTLQVFNKAGIPIPYKEIEKLEDTRVIMLDLGYGTQLALLNYGELYICNRITHCKQEDVNYHLVDNTNLLAFSYTENNKTGLAIYDFTNPEMTNECQLGQTPPVFDKINKIYAHDYFAYVSGVIDGRKCLAICGGEKFTCIFPDKLPDLKQLTAATAKNPVEIRMNTVPVWIDCFLNEVPAPK